MRSRKRIMYKAVFIDWDNTLGDFSGSSNIAMETIYEKEHLERFFRSYDEWREIYMPYNIQLWELYGEGKITKQQLSADRFNHPFVVKGYNNLQDFAIKIEEQFEQLTTEYTRLLPHAKELLEYLAAKYPITVVTNGFPEVQHTKFEMTGVNHLFTHKVISEEVGVNKPDKRIFDIALRINNIDATEAIMIGDHYNVDIIGAQNAGIDQIFLCNDTDEDNALPATYHVHELLEIRDIL